MHGVKAHKNIVLPGLAVLLLFAPAVSTQVAWADQMDRDKSAVLVGEDDRLTVKEFAIKHELPIGSVEAQVAATGKIACPWLVATANLVERDDLVVTNSHVFFDREGRPKGSMGRCRFVITLGGVEKQFRLSDSYIAGHMKREARTKSAQDWLVARLKNRVPGVTPYSVAADKNPLAPRNQAEGGRHWNVTVIAAGHDDWRGRDGRSLKGVKSIASCKIRDITWPGFRLTDGDVRELRSDCDSGPGSSGGAYLYDLSGEQTLVGLITGPGLGSSQERGAYHKAEHHNRGVLLSGAFLEAVNTMVYLMGVATVQQALTDLGYQPGPVDGQMGTKTRNAIKAFEKREGLPVTGAISAELSRSIKLKLD